MQSSLSTTCSGRSRAVKFHGFILKVKIKGDSMWPTFNDGDIIACEHYDGQSVSAGDLVVFTHPFKSGVTCVKRVKSLTGKGYLLKATIPTLLQVRILITSGLYPKMQFLHSRKSNHLCSKQSKSIK